MSSRHFFQILKNIYHCPSFISREENCMKKLYNYYMSSSKRYPLIFYYFFIKNAIRNDRSKNWRMLIINRRELRFILFVQDNHVTVLIPLRFCFAHIKTLQRIQLLSRIRCISFSCDRFEKFVTLNSHNKIFQQLLTKLYRV